MMWTWDDAGRLDTVVWRDTDTPQTVDEPDGWRWTRVSGMWPQHFRAAQLSLPINEPVISAAELDDLAAELQLTAERWCLRLRLAVGPWLQARSGGYALGKWLPAPAPGWLMLGIGNGNGGVDERCHTLQHELWHVAMHHRILSADDLVDVRAYGDSVRAVVRKRGAGPRWLLDPDEAEAEGYACHITGEAWPAGVSGRHGFQSAVTAWRRLAGA